MLDLKPLLQTLSKVSLGRILPKSQETEEDDLCQAMIPITRPNPAEKTEQTLRRYAKDWVKRRGDFAAEAKFQKAEGDFRFWRDEDGTETPLYGILVLTWWKAPPKEETPADAPRSFR